MQTAQRRISFKVSRDEARLIDTAVDRAERIARDNGLDFDAKSSGMDLTACHANGCPLDFDALLAFHDADFGHDVFGITRYIDRKTGELTACFLPRCSKSCQEPVDNRKGLARDGMKLVRKLMSEPQQ